MSYSTRGRGRRPKRPKSKVRKMNQISPSNANTIPPLVANELSRGKLPKRIEWDTTEEEENFVTDATEIFLQVQSAAHKKLPAWAQRAAENQNDDDISDLSRTVSTSPATLALQAQVLRSMLSHFEGTCDKVLADSLARGLALLCSRREEVVCGAELLRQMDTLEHLHHQGKVKDKTDARSDELTAAEDAAIAAIAVAPAANLAQFGRKLEILLQMSGSKPFYDAAPEALDALVAGVKKDAARLLL